MAALTRFLKPYYVLQAAMVLVYAVIRTYYPRASVRRPTDFMPSITWETQILLMLALILFRKYRASATVDQWVDSVIVLSKCTVASLLLWTDHRLFAWYFVAWMMLYLTVRRPQYSGPADVVALTQSTLTSTVLNGDPSVTWVVLFTASWSDACANLVPAFSDLSVRFSTPKLKFARLDASLHPEAAEDFSISTASTSAQLPTVMLFEGGREAKRLPPISATGDVTRVKIDAAGIVAVFELERRLVGTAMAKDKRS